MAFDRGIRSPSLELVWRGWRASTSALAAAGWRFRMQEDNFNWTFKLLGHDETSGLTMYSHIRGDVIEELARTNGWGSQRIGPLPVSLLPGEYRSVTMPDLGDLSAYEEVDMRPQIGKVEIVRPGDLFAKVTPTGQPDVEPLAFEAEQIPEVLARIRELQAPRAREILHRSIREAEERKRIVTPLAQVFHANIVSVQEANAA